MDYIQCPGCGSIIKKELSVCPKCGHKFQKQGKESSIALESESTVAIKESKHFNIKKALIIGFALFFIILLIGIAYSVHYLRSSSVLPNGIKWGDSCETLKRKDNHITDRYISHDGSKTTCLCEIADGTYFGVAAKDTTLFAVTYELHSDQLDKVSLLVMADKSGKKDEKIIESLTQYFTQKSGVNPYSAQSATRNWSTQEYKIKLGYVMDGLIMVDITPN